MSLSHLPLVSIIIPCYNQANYLEDALSSVLSQTYTNWECIIIDDGSTDDSFKVASQWVARDKRFSIYRIENGGVANARNFGISQSKGTWILPLDGDDYIENIYLEEASKFFDTDVRLIYGGAKKTGIANRVWNLPVYDYDLLLANNIIYVSALYRKKDFLKTNGYDSNLRHGFEDWDFWLCLLTPDDKVAYINKLVFYYRIKETSRNSSVSYDTEKYQESLQYIRNKHYEKLKSYYNGYEYPLRRIESLILENRRLTKIVESRRVQILLKLFSLLKR